jgi:hypothetical protein
LVNDDRGIDFNIADLAVEFICSAVPRSHLRAQERFAESGAEKPGGRNRGRVRRPGRTGARELDWLSWIFKFEMKLLADPAPADCEIKRRWRFAGVTAGSHDFSSLVTLARALPVIVPSSATEKLKLTSTVSL